MSNFEETLNIHTPENVFFGFQVAGIGSRFIAAMVDTCLILILQIVVNILLLILVQSFLDIETNDRLFSWLIAIIGIISFAFLWGYYIFFEIIWNGQSPGKRLAGLRVIRADGMPISFTESAIRNLVRLIDFLPAFYGVGIITMFVNDQARRIGDLAAGTLVVLDKGEISLANMEKFQLDLNPGPFALGLANQLPIKRIPQTNIQTAEDYLTRRHELTNRTFLGERILKQLFAIMEVPLSESFISNDADKLIAAIVYLFYKEG